MVNGRKGHITSEIALYYLSLGKDYFNGRWEEGLKEKVTGIMKDVERMGTISKQDKQEVWEVLTYLNIGKHSAIDLYEYKKLADFLGHDSLVGEWDKSLILFNSDILYYKWEQMGNPITTQKWNDFKEYYSEYTQFLKRPQTLYLTFQEVLGVMGLYESKRLKKGLNKRSGDVLGTMLRGDEKEYRVYNYKKTVELLRSRGYKVKDLNGNYKESIIKYTLDDVLEIIELYYPQLTEEESYEVKVGLDYFTLKGLVQGIKYGDIINEVDVKGDLFGNNKRELYFK